MSFFIGLLFVLLGGFTMWSAATRPNAFSIFSATLGLFSIGYYSLPLVLRSFSTLDRVSDVDVNEAALMSIIYIICVLASFRMAASRSGRFRGFQFREIDRLAVENWWPVTTIAAILYLAYIMSTTLTFYNADSIEDYLQDRSQIVGILGFFSNYLLAILSLNFAIAIQQRRMFRVGVVLLIYAVIEVRLAQGAQRLLFITPIFMVVTALAGLRQYRVAGTALLTGVAALLVVSPFFVAQRGVRGDAPSARTQVSYEKGVGVTTLQSIADRSDLIYNMTFLKRYVDSHGYVGPLFYESVLVTPIPRFLMRNKPFVLSDNGRPDGEASILAWRLIVGESLGSLTAFGPIVAYREGGWAALVFDGLAAGVLFALSIGIAARSGFFGLAFLPLLFLNFTVTKVPTSFFEGLAGVLVLLPMLFTLLLVNAFLALATGRPDPAFSRQPRQSQPRR